MSYVPQRGDIVWIDFNPQTGHEQSERRPGLVLSPEAYNRYGLCIICPITSVSKGYRWEVLLSRKLRTSGQVLSDQFKSLDWRSRRAEFREKAEENTLTAVRRRIQFLIP